MVGLFVAALSVPGLCVSVVTSRASVSFLNKLSTLKAESEAPDDGPLSGINYSSRGCVRMTQVQGRRDIEAGHHLMTPDFCFVSCKRYLRNSSFFGLYEGNKCWCGQSQESESLQDYTCDLPCEGRKDQTCGGRGEHVMNVFHMFNCTTPSAWDVQQRNERYRQQRLDSFVRTLGRTCSRHVNNRVEVDGRFTMIGDVDACKLSCAGDSLNCDGFTYDVLTNSCFFHEDTRASIGNITQSSQFECYRRA